MMPASPLTMHKIRELLRLAAAGLSQPQIARVLEISLGVVNKYLQAARRAELGWPLPEDLSDAQLRQRLFADQRQAPPLPKVLPDFATLHQELKRKGVTRYLLWEEYAAQYPEQHYSYTRFAELYQAYRQKLRVTIRQTHRAGEKLFVDYAGPTVEIINPETGEVRAARIFVAVLGASNFAYAEATWTQSLPDWCGSHVRAFEFLGGVTELVVPDNLKSAVTTACRYEPELNRTYQEMLAHYDTAAVPARPYRPRDKAKVESGVLLVERWVLARLRHRQFFSLHELNQAIRGLLDALNDRPFKKLPGSRRSQFEALDRPALKPLPASRYEYAEWLPPRKVAPDSHLEVDGHYYSAPHPLIGQRLEVRLTSTGVEIFHQRNRVALHPRSDKRGSFTTQLEHLPTTQQLYLQEWTPGRFLNWAIEIGPSTRDLVRQLLESRRIQPQAYRSCFGLLSLAKRYSPTRLEAACSRALALGLPTRRSVLAILQKGLDQVALETDHSTPAPLPHHANIRGAGYYQQLLFEGAIDHAETSNARSPAGAETDRNGECLPPAVGTNRSSSTTF
jgi:transposase